MSRGPSLTLPLFDEQPAVPPPPVRPPSPPPPRPPATPVQPQPVSRPGELWGAVQWPEAAALPSLEAAAEAAQRFTPRVCLEPPDALLLELRGSLALFGGLARLRADLQALFPAATVALAPTPRAALALACAGRRCGLADPSRFLGRLAPLSLDCLRWPAEARVRLAAVGVRTIGEVLRLPRAGFAQRFGSGLLDALDRLTGRSPDPRAAFVPLPRVRARCEPSWEPSGAQGVLRVIEPLLESLEGFLRERQRGLTALRLTLEHRGHAPTRCVLRLAAPEQSATAFARLFAIRLERLPLPAPVRRCTLQSGPLLHRPSTDGALWQPGEQGGGAAVQLPAFLEQLRARLGEGAVHGLGHRPEHRPERLTQALSPDGRGKPAVSMPWAPGRRPLWLLPRPRPLQSAGDGSGHPSEDGQRLNLLAGPERIETGWWDGGDVTRDYYLAAGPDGARLWIYRERGEGGWFLHGYFG